MRAVTHQGRSNRRQRSATGTAQRSAMADVTRQKSAEIIVVAQVGARRRVEQRTTRISRNDLGGVAVSPDGEDEPANKPKRALNQDEDKKEKTERRAARS